MNETVNETVNETDWKDVVDSYLSQNLVSVELPRCPYCGGDLLGGTVRMECPYCKMSLRWFLKRKLIKRVGSDRELRSYLREQTDVVSHDDVQNLLEDRMQPFFNQIGENIGQLHRDVRQNKVNIKKLRELFQRQGKLTLEIMRKEKRKIDRFVKKFDDIEQLFQGKNQAIFSVVPSDLFKAAGEKYRRGRYSKALENYARYLSGGFKPSIDDYPPHELAIRRIPSEDLIDLILLDIDGDFRDEVLTMYQLSGSTGIYILNEGGRKVFEVKRGEGRLTSGKFFIDGKVVESLLLYLKNEQYNEGTITLLDYSSEPFKEIYSLYHQYSKRIPLNTLTTGDVDGDGISEVIVGTARGYTGEKGRGIGLSVWNLEKDQRGVTVEEQAFTISGLIEQIATVDLTHDNQAEILTIEKGNNIQCYTFENGQIQNQQLKRNLQGDRILPGTHEAVIVNKQDEELWLVDTENDEFVVNNLSHGRDVIPKIVALPDIDGDGTWELYGATENQSFLSLEDPYREWNSYDQGLKTIDQYNVIGWGDMDGDNCEEILINSADILHLIEYREKNRTKSPER